MDFEFYIWRFVGEADGIMIKLSLFSHQPIALIWSLEIKLYKGIHKH